MSSAASTNSSSPEVVTAIVTGAIDSPGAGFEGYYVVNSTTFQESCPSSMNHFVSGSFAGCFDASAATRNVIMPTACNGSGWAQENLISECGKGSFCSSLNILPSPGAATSENVLRYRCFSEPFPVRTLYSAFPASVSATTTSLSDSGNSKEDSDTRTPTIHQGAIAGITVGCVVGSVILGALLFLFRKKIRGLFRKPQSAEESPEEGSTAKTFPVSELPSTSNVYEADTKVMPQMLEAESNTMHEADNNAVPGDFTEKGNKKASTDEVYEMG